MKGRYGANWVGTNGNKRNLKYAKNLVLARIFVDFLFLIAFLQGMHRQALAFSVHKAGFSKLCFIPHMCGEVSRV